MPRPRAAPQAKRRPSRTTRSSHARSRPIEVAAPWPGKTRTWSSSRARRASDAAIASGEPPGRSTRPQPAANNVSPLKSESLVGGVQRDGACGVAGRVEHVETQLPEPDHAALGKLDGRHGRRDVERGDAPVRMFEAHPVQGVNGDLGAGVGRQRGVVADMVPVAVGRDDEPQRPAARVQLAPDDVQRRDRRVDGDRLTAARVGQHVDVRGQRPDRPDEVVHGPDRATRRPSDAPRRRPMGPRPHRTHGLRTAERVVSYARDHAVECAHFVNRTVLSGLAALALAIAVTVGLDPQPVAAAPVHRRYEHAALPSARSRPGPGRPTTSFTFSVVYQDALATGPPLHSSRVDDPSGCDDVGTFAMTASGPANLVDRNHVRLRADARRRLVHVLLHRHARNGFARSR